MTKANTNPKLSRRHMLAAGASLAAGGAVMGTRGAHGAGLAGANLDKESLMFDDCAPVYETQDNDSALETLYAEWEPLAAASKEANEAASHAYDLYEDGRLSLTARAVAGDRVAAIGEEIMRRNGVPEFCKGETLEGLGIPADYFGEEEKTLAKHLRNVLGEHLREDETIPDFMRDVNAEVLRKERHDTSLKERLQVDALEKAYEEAAGTEGVVVDTIAATPAEGMIGLVIKAKVWEGVSGNYDLAHSIMNDIRRLGGLAPISLGAFIELSGV